MSVFVCVCMCMCVVLVDCIHECTYDSMYPTQFVGLLLYYYSFYWLFQAAYILLAVVYYCVSF